MVTEIWGRIEGLGPNGEHGFHIHELGDLTKGCDSLGGHYNPFGEEHGGIESCHSHVGDLGNLKADSNGVAEFNMTVSKIHIVGAYSILGRSCVVHLAQDDLGQGDNKESALNGNSGPRIGCAVVGRTTSSILSTKM